MCRRPATVTRFHTSARPSLVALASNESPSGSSGTTSATRGPCGVRREPVDIGDLAQSVVGAQPQHAWHIVEQLTSDCDGAVCYGLPSLYPSPYSTFPGRAPVIFPSAITGTPFTSTQRIPTDN